jgi:CheY-like chemotaxis protein
MHPRILLVDDEPDFLEIIGEFLLEHGYALETAPNGPGALRMLDSMHFDLLLSDINMPGMKGFELLAKARERYPALRTMLITAYDVRDYLMMARRYDIGNILTKSTPFNFDELRLSIENVITGDIFGISRYIRSEVSLRRIREAASIESVIREICALANEEYSRRFRQALGEILINAFFYGARSERGDDKDHWNFEARLADHEAIEVRWSQDNDKMAVAVRDHKGRLTKKEILYWLDRNATVDSRGISVCLRDGHGKGLHIARETVDRMIINIERSRQTEVILINYRHGRYKSFRPLWIQEI